MSYSILAEPPSEERIVKRWRPERGNLVSICMLVYNHGPYLRDALHSILNQKTDFGFELLVHDDASQDASPSIIREYAARYPNIIKPILQTVNQHSQRIYPSVHFNYPRAKLPFVAMCEGDDHWTDENKLQTQVDGLQAHPDINLSFHAATFVDYLDTGNPARLYGDYETTDAIIPLTDVMHRVRGWIPLASCMIRQSAKVQLLDFLQARPYLTLGEIYFQFFGALSGGALYFARPMSLYRYRTEHSWTRKTMRDRLFKATHEVAMIRSYIELDQLTHGNHHQDFLGLIFLRLLWLFNPETPPRTLPSVDRLEITYKACQVEIEQTLTRLEQAPARYAIFGCGSGCKRILDTLSPEKIVAVVDRDSRHIGEDLEGKPIIGSDMLHEYPDCGLVVSTIAPNRNAISQLAANAGIPDERIHYLFDGALLHLEKNPISLDIFDQ